MVSSLDACTSFAPRPLDRLQGPGRGGGVNGEARIAGAPQPNAYAVIIGIEKYHDLPSPTGARADAERFAELAKRSLGPEGHIHLALDKQATKGTGAAAGLFTDYVIQGLGTGAADLDGDGQISLQELSDYVRPRVSREARKDNRDQKPSLVVGQALGSPSSFIVAWGLPPK